MAHTRRAGDDEILNDVGVLGDALHREGEEGGQLVALAQDLLPLGEELLDDLDALLAGVQRMHPVAQFHLRSS